MCTAVTKPVADQLEYERISVCSFNHANQDLTMAPLLGELANLHQQDFVWRLMADGGSDAPLIKSIGVQRDSEVYGAFVKATEAGEEVRDWATFIEAILYLRYRLTPFADPEIRRVEDTSQQERPGANVQAGHDQWRSSHREHRGRSQGVSSGLADVSAADATRPVQGVTANRILFRTTCSVLLVPYRSTYLSTVCTVSGDETNTAL
jgi:hypothetical protein